MKKQNEGNNIIKQLLFLGRKVTKERNMKKELKPVIQWETKVWIHTAMIIANGTYDVITYSKN